MKRILIIENQLNLKKVIERWLVKEGYSVVTCSSGEVALDLMRSNDFFVILTDFKMSRISGLKVARMAKNLDLPVPVFLISAYTEGIKNNSWAKLFDRIFPKPIDKKDLLKAIRELDTASINEIDDCIRK